MSAELFAELDRLNERNRRLHGAARAALAHWTALLRLSTFLYACEGRRRERAMLEALEALERARAAEEGEARWLRVGCWIAKRVDAAAARVGRRTRIVTRIDFSPSPSMADYGEALEPTDLQTVDEEGEIKW